MYLIVGLGNPGKKYEGTRHNIGFDAVELLMGSEKWEEKYESQFLKFDDVILAKPQTFMNNSGRAVAEMLKFYPAAQLVVVHDELDLSLGALKIQKDITAAGHNGVQSIIDAIGTKDFIRIRLGVNNPETRGQIPGEDFVLQKFTAQEQEIANQILEQTKNAIETLQTEGLELAQSKFNG